MATRTGRSSHPARQRLTGAGLALSTRSYRARCARTIVVGLYLSSAYARIAAAMAAGRLPEQDPALAAAAVVGLLVEGLIGPLAPKASGRERETVQSLTLAALRALGVADARARGLVVQTAMPAELAKSAQ